MPIYEYECPECGHRREDFKTLSRRNDEVLCDECLHPCDRLMPSGLGIKVHDAKNLPPGELMLDLKQKRDIEASFQRMHKEGKSRMDMIDTITSENKIGELNAEVPKSFD